MSLEIDPKTGMAKPTALWEEYVNNLEAICEAARAVVEEMDKVDYIYTPVQLAIENLKQALEIK